MSYELHCMDALEWLATLPVGRADAILTDLPYGTTACAWDEVIPFAPMWEQVKRVLKPRGVFVTTASQPFTSKLVMSNLEWFRYELIWDKVNKYTGSLNANRMPLKRHENIVVFYGGLPTFNKQLRQGKPYVAHNTKGHGKHTQYGHRGDDRTTVNNGDHNPCSILPVKGDCKLENGLHPTQKPVALYAYLIRTYTNPGDMVIDFCMGSGTTGVAAIKEGRNFMGNDSDAGYVAIGTRRLADAAAQLPLPLDA